MEKSSRMDLDSLPGSEISMELDPSGHMNFRTYPSISDYYNASSVDRNKPIQLQPGLSNYSSLVLGDDRITFSESIMSATYRVAVEDKMAIVSPSKSKTKHSRRRDYQEAHDKVGDLEIDRLERLMKDKLLQRSKMTSSPFQVFKAFKFFDREGVGKIHIEGFTRALEFLGFQFSEVQNMALFARYDTSFSGEIDYMSFIAKAMMYDPISIDELANASAHKKKAAMNSAGDYDETPDIDPNELKALQQSELRRVFDKVDRERRGALNKDEFELLLMAIGHSSTSSEVDRYFDDMGVGSSDRLPFATFFEWWTSDVGANLFRKHK